MPLANLPRREEYPEGSPIARLNPDLKAAALDHGGRLHPAESKGRVIVAHKDGGRWKQRSYDVCDLPDVIPLVAGLEDAYISQQRFYFKRSLTQLQQLGALYVDIDFHKVPELAGMDARGVLEDVLIALERAKIPEPSMAIASGRGLYVIWLIEAIPRDASKRWAACQHELWKVLKPFGADPNALDVSRVLRLAGTKNSKNGAIVEQIAPPGEVWKFDDLAEEILPLGREELYDLRIQRAARDARKPREARQGNAQGKTPAKLWAGRLTDLQMLRQLRWFGDLPPGQRDHWMFVAGVAMSWLAATPRILQNELWELSKEAASWNEREAGARLQAIMKRAHMAAKGETVEWNGFEVDARYKFKNQTIIELLEIEDWEMEEMDVIISPDIKNRRATKAKRESRREAGVLPREKYEATAGERKMRASELRAQGMKQKEIAEILGCSQQEVSRLIKGLDKRIQQSVSLYGGVALPEGAAVGGTERVPKSGTPGNAVHRETFSKVNRPLSKETPAEVAGCKTADAIRRGWEDTRYHGLSCDCVECSAPPPRYVRYAV